MKKYYVDFFDDYYYDSDPFTDSEKVSNEIAVTTQVSGNKNALKLLGCCLETQAPTIVFEFPMNGNLCDLLMLYFLTPMQSHII